MTNEQIRAIVNDDAKAYIKYSMLVTAYSKSKYDYESLLEKINEFSKAKAYTAKELGIKGATASILVRMGVLEIVGMQEVWFRVDEDNMRRGEINVYRINKQGMHNAKGFLEHVKAEKEQNLQKRIANLEMQIDDFKEELRKLRGY